MGSLFFLIWLYFAQCVDSSSWLLSQHLATKSPYFIPDVVPRGLNASCPIDFIQLVARHGTRNPTTSDVNSLNAMEKIIFDNRDSINASAYSWILRWRSPFTLDNQGELVTPGEMEHFNLAIRMKQRYSLLRHPYNPAIYNIQATVVSRASQSASSFGYGLWKDSGKLPQGFQPFSIYSESGSMDFTLRFFANCPLYKQNAKSELANYEIQKYLESIFPRIQAKLNQRLGGTWVTAELIDTMYTACVFQVAINGVQDRWCALFDQEDIEQIEYLNDLEAYWLKSYGFPINYQMTCPLIKEIIGLFDAKIDGKFPLAKAKLRFAHAETVIPLIAVLGLYKDPYPLQWNTSNENIQNRKFRTAHFSSFASNVAFLLLNCDGQFMIQVLSNEIPVLVPGCPDVNCPYDVFRGLFQSYLDCDFDKLCERKPSHSFY